MHSIKLDVMFYFKRNVATEKNAMLNKMFDNKKCVDVKKIISCFYSF